MQIDERVVRKMPRSVQNASGHRRTSWKKRQAMQAVWEIRERVLRETGEDIFNVFVYPDRVEVNVRGEMDTVEHDLDPRRFYWAARRDG